MTIAYLSNRFPSDVEPYVEAEIGELRRRGVEVVTCSILRSSNPQSSNPGVLYFSPLRLSLAFAATWIFVCHISEWVPLVGRAFASRRESFGRRMRTILQSWLGAYLTAGLRERGVQHIHVHHGYFAAWVAMVCARILGIGYSLTLHGSDLLVDDNFLDIKLSHCKFCATISEFNRRHIQSHYPNVHREKILLHRMGVDCEDMPPIRSSSISQRFRLLAVGRLHSIKDHAFLIRACRTLKDQGLPISGAIAGDGPEKDRLESLITGLDLKGDVKLLGPTPHSELNSLYDSSDLVVLTSKSEGIPLVLMEAMARGRLVLAPRITGIPELVADGETGFLYEPGSIDDFVSKVQQIRHGYSEVEDICLEARRRVQEHFNRPHNTARFCDALLEYIGNEQESKRENSVLQQVRLPI